MPTDLKTRVDSAAMSNGRSINSEIIDRLTRSFASTPAPDLAAIPDGLLLDEVISRYGAKVQIIVDPEAAAAAGIKTKPTRPAR